MSGSTTGAPAWPEATGGRHTAPLARLVEKGFGADRHRHGAPGLRPSLSHRYPEGWRATFIRRDHSTRPWVGQILSFHPTPWRAVQHAAWVVLDTNLDAQGSLVRTPRSRLRLATGPLRRRDRGCHAIWEGGGSAARSEIQANSLKGFFQSY